ncbi:MAG TPA: hypothetical protein VE198_17575 [Actinoallomurus sp.]|nr:hypothetical protein [Actinoallomurus sp.]
MITIRATADGDQKTPQVAWRFTRISPKNFRRVRFTVPKLVASRTLTDASAWANSRVIDGDLVDAVKRERRDVIITGSLSVVHALMAEDLVNEYRLLTFPTTSAPASGSSPPAARPPIWTACRQSEPAPPFSRGTGGRADGANRCQVRRPVRSQGDR